MDLSINFLSQKELDKQKINEKKKAISYSFILAISLYLILALGVFTYQFLLSNKKKSIDQKIEVSKNQIQSLSETEYMSSLLSEKTKSLRTILAGKKKHHKVIDYLFNILPDGVSISSFILNEDNELSFSVQTNSLVRVKTFIDNIRREQNSDLRISSVILSNFSMSRSDESSSNVIYGFSIKIQFVQ